MQLGVQGLRVRRLEDGENVAEFDCGDADLNDFVMHDSGNYSREQLAVSYVVEDASGKVCAYFSLATDKVSLNEFADRAEFNRFRKSKFVNDKRIRNYPAVKICRLAVDLSARDRHIGSFVLLYVKTFINDDRRFGCRFLTVDAYLAAVPFYLKYGFAPLTAADEGAEHTGLLYFDLKALL